MNKNLSTLFPYSEPISLSPVLSPFQPADSGLLPPDEQERSATRRSVDQVASIRTGVTIVSNSGLWRAGLGQLLAPYVDLYVVGSYREQPRNGSSRLDMPGMDLLLTLPDPSEHIILLDGNMGQELAVTWIRYWRSLIPLIRIVILEVPNDNDMILACIEAGARGYMLRDTSMAELVESIKQVQQGAVVCSPEVTARLYRCLDYFGVYPPAAGANRTMGAQPHIQASNARQAGRVCIGPTAAFTPLTARELEVLCQIAANYSNQEIAGILVIQIPTVKNHVHSILQKLKLHDRRYAARFAIEQGWIDVPGHLHQ